MRHRFIAVLALLVVAVLAACGGAGAPTPTPQPTNPAAPQATPAPQTSGPAKPAATPDIKKVLNVQPEDWKRGPADAKVTIIEWGDFQ